MINGSLSEPNLKQALKDKGIREKVNKFILDSYKKLRVCCFTTSHENPLSWAHYADSHKGYCVKFSGKGKVISQARRIDYTDNYPELIFPLLTQMIKFAGPMLTKSKVWSYENEYRSTLNPNHEKDLESHAELTRNEGFLKELELKHDGECLSLEEDEITDVYFGVNMPNEHKKEIKGLVKNGPFQPKYWSAYVSKDEYKLKFRPYK